MQKDRDKILEEWSPLPFGNFKQLSESGIHIRMSGPEDVWSYAFFLLCFKKYRCFEFVIKFMAAN